MTSIQSTVLSFRDVALSGYFQNFQNLNFTWSLEDIAAYYLECERLMAHWRQVLPLPIHDVYTRNLIIITVLFAGLAQAWNVLGGYCGQISLSHALYFGVGAYVSTLLLTRAGIPPTVGMFAGGALGGLMALLVGQAVLDHQPALATWLDLPGRALAHAKFENRLAGQVAGLRRWANANVLRGLLALEQGDVEEAEVAFRLALDLWKDEAAAASGAGLDFPARPIAQGCLAWLR